MISKKIESAINDQINFELYSAYIYQSMSAFAEGKSLKGFANWLAIQAKEEMTHAMKLYRYLLDRGGKVVLTTIDGPETEWDNMTALFDDVLNHEIKVTEKINNIVNLAAEEKDNATVIELQWFVKEQVEEEANASEILDELKLINSNGAGLMMLDRELRGRVFVDETQAE